jgi:hypothetical protein
LRIRRGLNGKLRISIRLLCIVWLSLGFWILSEGSITLFQHLGIFLLSDVEGAKGGEDLAFA